MGEYGHGDQHGQEQGMSPVQGNLLFDTMVITIPRGQEDDRFYEPSAYFQEPINSPTRRVLAVSPSSQLDFSGSRTLGKEQEEARNNMSSLLGLVGSVFEDEALALSGPSLMELYADPSRGLLADSSCYGPPNASDPRSREEKAQCCAAALRADCMRIASLASGYLPVDAMNKWHPNLAARYLRYQMMEEEKEEAAGNMLSLEGEAREAARVVVSKHVTFLDCLGRKLMMDAAFSSPASQILDGAPTAIEQIMAFLGHEDRMLVGDLTWVKDFWEAVSRDPSVLARTCPPVHYHHVDSRDPAEYEVKPAVAPAYMVRPPAPTTSAPDSSMRHVCPYLEACMTGDPAKNVCTSKTCVLRGLTMKDQDDMPVHAERYAYFPLEKVLQWLAMETGPYDNRKRGNRTYVFYGANKEWLDVKAVLDDLGYFESIEGAGIATLAALNWTRAALRRRELLNHRGDQPKGCMAGYALGAPNGVVLIDQCLFTGEKAGFLNHRVPEEILQLLENEDVYKVQSGIHEEGRFADMGAELKGYVDCTLLALTQFPQPGVEPGRMQCSPTYVASRLNSPAIPIMVHQDGRRKRHALEGRSVEGRAFYVDLAEMDFSVPSEDWSSDMKLHVFCTMSIPFALMWKAASRAMELENCSPQADALRYLRLLLVRLAGMPGVNGIGKTSLQRRPWNLIDIHERAESRHGVPLRAEWVLLDKAEANSVRHPLPSKKMYLSGKKYLYDHHNLDRDLLTFLKDFTGGEPLRLTWGMIMDYHFQMGACSPHVCSKCGSPDHLEARCTATNLLCLYPLCRSTAHLLYVCHRMWIRCEKCQLYGHLAQHHADGDFVKTLENFRFCSLFNRRTLSLHSCAAFACSYGGRRPALHPSGRP